MTNTDIWKEASNRLYNPPHISGRYVGSEHTVRVWFTEDTETIPNPPGNNSPLCRVKGLGTFSSDYEIDHTKECDKLPYGQNCELDQWTTEVGYEDFPTESGVYTVWLEAWQSYEGEWDSALEYSRVGNLPGGYPERIYCG